MFSRLLIKKLSPRAQTIIDYLNHHRQRAVGMKIQAFASKMGVHPSFVTRTLKKVGYKGWKDWVAFAGRDRGLKRPDPNYLKFLEKTLFSGIKNTLKRINNVKLNLLVNKIAHRKFNSIVFTGSGYSFFIAQDQVLRYNLINYPSSCYDEKVGDINSIAKNNLIFVVSISSHTSLTDKQMQFLSSEKRATIVLISGLPIVKNNPHFDFTIDASLYGNRGIIENKAPTFSRIIIYAVLDLIYWKVFSKDLAKNNQYLEMLKEH